MELRKANRIVIKIGSSLLYRNGSIDELWLKSLCEDIANLVNKGVEVIVTSSGAIAAGREFIKSTGDLSISQKQAAAAVGQPRLMRLYHKNLQKLGLQVAQILLVSEDVETKKRSENAIKTINNLLAEQIIPVINENDSVATREIVFGDNDSLAAQVAKLTKSDLCILFSDVEGLYDSNPNKNKDTKFINEVAEITKEIESYAGGSCSLEGTGGMITKIDAAKLCNDNGIDCVITSGLERNPLSKLFEGKRHTIFKA